MNKLIWKSEEEQEKELKERIESWKEGQSKDGLILIAEGKFVYKGVAYLIKVMRYFNHTNEFTTMGQDRISDKHAVVEYPEETKPIVEFVSGIEDVFDFLYHDTLHSHNDKQTIEEQIKECHRLAKEDIDNILSGALSKKIDNSIHKLLKLKEKLKKLTDKVRKK